MSISGAPAPSKFQRFYPPHPYPGLQFEVMRVLLACLHGPGRRLKHVQGLSGSAAQTPIALHDIALPYRIRSHYMDFENSEPFAMGPVQFRRPRKVAENWSTKPKFWEPSVIFPKEKSKTQSSLNFLQSRPRKFTKTDFFGIGPDPVSSEQQLLPETVIA